MSLDQIAYDCGTDKGTRSRGPLGPKSYTLEYERLLYPRRGEPLRLLEIGIGGGGSLKMWHRYLPNAEIHGVDIRAGRCRHAIDRVTCHHGDAADAEFLGRLAAEYGPFEVVVDDGGHHSSQQVVAFHALWPHCTWWYAIEDLHTCYDSRYSDGETMFMLKELADDVNSGDVGAVRFSKSLAVIVR